MRKSLFLVAGTVLFGMLALSSCDKDEKKGPDVEAPVKVETLWENANGLLLTVDGNDIYGGSVYYVPDKNDATKASLQVKGELVDLSTLMSNLNYEDNAVKAILEVATLNVLPGSSALSLDITMDVADGVGSFEGRGETDYCTYSYRGQASEAALKLEFTDVALKNQTLAGTSWLPRTPEQNVNTIDIKCSDSSSKANGLVTLINMIRPLLTIDAKVAKITVDQYLCEALSSLNFYENGVWNIHYKKPFSDMVPVELPKTYLNYVIGENNTMLMYPNLGNIMRDMMSLTSSFPSPQVKSKAFDSAQIIGLLSGLLVQYLMDGVPFVYEKSNDALTLTLDPTVVDQIMSIVLPLLQQPDVQREILAAVSENPDMAMFASFLPSLLQSLPTELDADILISINFVSSTLAN